MGGFLSTGTYLISSPAHRTPQSYPELPNWMDLQPRKLLSSAFKDSHFNPCPSQSLGSDQREHMTFFLMPPTPGPLHMLFPARSTID